MLVLLYLSCAFWLVEHIALDALERVGFATNLNGLFADITLQGSLSGFSFGPFVGYEQYVDVTAGGISPLPAAS